VGALNLRRGRSAGREGLSKPDSRTNLQSRRGIERISTINANGDFGQPDVQQRSSPGPHFIVAGTRNTYPLLEALILLLFGMQGLGAYRTAEKVRGVAR